MKNIISKLMVLTAMSFFVSSINSFAKDSTGKQVKVETKKIMSSAQREIQKHALGLGLGQTFLFGKFEKKGENKVTTDILYSYTASYSFDLLLNFHYSEHEHKNMKVILRGYTMSIKARSYEFDAFSPFILGGLGFYMPQVQNAEGETSEAKYTFGFNAGAGVDLRLNRQIVVGILTQFHKPFEIKQDDTENVTGSYFKLLLTSMYLF
jgi:opacity protein-like surface antigen